MVKVTSLLFLDLYAVLNMVAHSIHLLYSSFAVSAGLVSPILQCSLSVWVTVVQHMFVLLFCFWHMYQEACHWSMLTQIAKMHLKKQQHFTLSFNANLLPSNLLSSTMQDYVLTEILFRICYLFCEDFFLQHSSRRIWCPIFSVPFTTLSKWSKLFMWYYINCFVEININSNDINNIDWIYLFSGHSHWCSASSFTFW